MFSSGICDDADFLTQHTLLQICYHMASVLKESETIIACYGMWECSGEERMDVRRRSRVVGVFSSGKSEGADFLAQRTMLQVCHLARMCLRKVRQ